MPDAVKITKGAFDSLLGLEATKHTDPSAQPDNVSFMRRYSKAELRANLTHTYVAPETGRADFSAAGIISYLKPVHKAIGDQMLNIDKMRALAPEIEQSRILVSSSIMSPNDLQDGEFLFSFDNVPGIGSDPDLAKEIADVYSEFYNKTLGLGIKSYDWIGDIQYSSGAKPILILPLATQIDLKNRTPEDAKKQLLDFGPGFASFEEFTKAEAQDPNADYFWSGKPTSWKDVLEKHNEKEIFQELIPSMEEFGVVVPTTVRKEERATIDMTNFGPEYQAGLESMIVNVRTRLEEGDVIKISENPEILRFATQKKLIDKHEVLKKLQNKYKTNTRPVIEQMVQLDPNPDDIPHRGHPTIIELPTEAVIPVHIPGAPKEHIGYFVLLDQFGQPLTIEASGMANKSTGCSPGSANAAYEALFGTGCCSKSFFGGNNDISSSGNLIFQHLLDNYIKARLKGIFGRDDLQLSRFNSIATTMFYRLLEQKKTMLVFVPPTLLHYFAFDYRKNGTGKSKLEDAQFLLSLRTTLMMAQIVAMANDAVEHKKVEFGVDDKAANLEAIMDLIANIFIAKNKLNGSIDPSEIMRDMYANALTIVPKTIPGLTDMTVEVQNSGGQSVRPDNELLEQITNLLVSHLDVPPAALNQMSEPEFARSLVTYNLFFAKKIARYQRIWCTMIQEFIRTHSSFDIPFKTALMKRLQASGKKRSNEKLPSKVEKLKNKNPNTYSDNYNKMLNSILENVEVSLATPNIVVDKTQFEEIRAFMSNLDELANHFFNQELVPTEDTLAQGALPILRAKWKRDQMIRFIEKVGSFNMVEIPDMDEIDPIELFDFIQTLQNVATGLNQQRENIGNAGETGGFGGDGGFGDESGMGDEMSGDMGMDMDLGDENMDMESDTSTESETTFESTSTTTQSSTEETQETETPTATMYFKHHNWK